MRSTTFMIATLAFSSLAVPAPIASPIFKSNAMGQNDRTYLPDHSKRQPEPFGRPSHPRDTDAAAEAEDNDEAFEARFTRTGGTRSLKPAPFGRASHSKREAEDNIQEGHEEGEIDELEARYFRGKHGSRSAEPEPSVRGPRSTEDDVENMEDLEDIEAHSAEPTPYTRGHPRDVDNEEDIAGEEIVARFSRGSHPKRDPEPFGRGSHPKRTAEPEPGTVRGNGLRKRTPEAKPEASVRGKSGKRTAEAQPEPINRINGS